METINIAIVRHNYYKMETHEHYVYQTTTTNPISYDWLSKA